MNRIRPILTLLLALLLTACGEETTSVSYADGMGGIAAQVQWGENPNTPSNPSRPIAGGVNVTTLPRQPP
jgi:hypothetical protein